jgi:hypothetical protein
MINYCITAPAWIALLPFVFIGLVVAYVRWFQ